MVQYPACCPNKERSEHRHTRKPDYTWLARDAGFLLMRAQLPAIVQLRGALPAALRTVRVIHFPPMAQQTLSEIVSSRINQREDLNCAETIVYAANRAYGLELPKSALKLAAGFGGGMGVQKTCGVITGASMVFSAMFVEDRGHESSKVKELNQEFFRRMEDTLGHVDCAPIKERWHSDRDGCLPVMIAAARVLQEIIDRELSNRSEPDNHSSSE